jgi:hypothetical protein
MSRSLIRQGNDLDCGIEAGSSSVESRSLIRQGNDLDSLGRV